MADTLAERFRLIPIEESSSAEAKLLTHRINSLGSLYYFAKVALRRNHLTPRLHLPVCLSFERSHLKDLYELPRDHFKTTICSEALPMWWALPFGNSDADLLSKLGYSAEFLAFMRRVHDSATRTLLVSETITNAAMLGSRTRRHFESNSVYRALFPETLPTTTETWTNFSLHCRRPQGGASHGEGTFDFIGVGSALQSRHYIRIVQDDLVGRKAVESQSVMDKTVDYHRLVVGAFESQDAIHENDELVVGNRWSYHDLNTFLREHEPWFRISSHSALGGCCPEHPPDTPIFPEMFSVEKLERIRRKLGSYNFSAQFLNNPAAPENAAFHPEWLRHFKLFTKPDGRLVVQHEVYDGSVRRDIEITHLGLAEVTDPAHAGNAGLGRCRHSVVVLGLSDDDHYYLLDCWASGAPYDDYFGKIYELADKWNIRKLGVETVAAQRFVAYHIDYRNRQANRYLKIIPLKGEVEGPDGTITRRKESRILTVLQPIFEEGRFWCQRHHMDFIGEYTTFPKGRFCDILDALAYAPQVLKSFAYSKFMPAWMASNRQRLQEMGKPYSVGVN